MAAELEPRTGRRDVIGRRFALGLDQQRELFEIFAVPAWEGLQQLQPLTHRRNVDGQTISVGGRRHKTFVSLREALGWKLFTLRRLELEGLAVRALERLIDRIESQIPR